MSELGNGDFPGLFQASDAAATRSQRNYARLVALDLAVMVLGATLGAISLSDPGLRQQWAFASALCIAASFALTYALKAEHLSSTWYHGRAIAESVKTATWRYMMGAEPYPRAIPDADADRAFGEANDSLLREKAELAGALPSAAMSTPQITPRMRAVRSLSLDERKSVYLSSRLDDQRRWYATHAEASRRRARLFYRMVLLCQALALVAVIALVRWPGSQVNLTGVFTALAAALIGWTQLRKYDELASVYGMSAQKLASLIDRMPHVADEEQFSTLIGLSEDVISRENSSWVARRRR